jgi:excisionase family DNA binding protein
MGDNEASDEKRNNERRIMELRRNPPIFMTLQETADFLQVSKDTVRRWAKAGRIRQYNRGTRNPLFASAELIQSIKEAC